MALVAINLGAAPNDGTGDPLRTALGKVNSNFAQFATVALSGAYADLTGKPSLATVATTGAYADLSGSPTILKGNVTAADPTVANDNTQGYVAGSSWLNTATQVLWTAMSVATGAAVWRPPTEVLVSEIITAASQASVAFPTLPTWARDLEIRIIGRGDTAALSTSLLMQVNGDTTANYDYNAIFNSSATAAANVATLGGTSINLGSIPAATAPAGAFSLNRVRIGDYNGANSKEMSMEGHAKLGTTTTTLSVSVGSMLYRGTAAIASGLLFMAAGNFANGSIVSFYARR